MKHDVLKLFRWWIKKFLFKEKKKVHSLLIDFTFDIYRWILPKLFHSMCVCSNPFKYWQQVTVKWNKQLNACVSGVAKTSTECMQISYWWFLGDLLLALLEDIWGHLLWVLIILCYIFCIVIKHLKLLYVLQTIIAWKEFELDTCFNFNLWNVWIDFL